MKGGAAAIAQIHVLDKQTAELIAAGEVIDRPASVIKELVENALDAGATQITAEIQNGGVTFMRVTDNGCGIAADDIRRAFLRHATSKLRSPEDLQGILTMGFRGEALASVAAMCRVEVLSRCPGCEAGVRYCIEGGEETACEPAGCPEGTTILVRDIFYNTPARMKFLKRDAAEGAAVGAALERLAAVNPRVAFRFLRDGKALLATPGNNRLSDAVYAVWGRDFYRTLTEARGECKGIRVRGYVSKPADARGSRSMQHFFVNGRCVRSRVCTAALEQAYHTRIMKGRFPACVLDVLVPPAVCDVNVHPAKLEVRFADEKAVFDAVYFTARAALDALDARGVEARLDPALPAAPPAAAPEAPSGEGAPHPPAVGPRPVPSGGKNVLRDGTALMDGALVVPAAVARAFTHLRPAPPDDGQEELSALPQTAPPPRREPDQAREEPPAQTALPEAAPAGGAKGRYGGARVLGELFATYILLESAGELVLIDKHAAHERLNYERLRAGRETRRQALLEPVAVTLPREEYEALLAEGALVGRLGFGVEDFGGGCVLVREIPTMLGVGDVLPAVTQIAEKLAGVHGAPDVGALEELYHSIACKASVRAGDETGERELAALVGLLDEHADVRFCPHGRPIAVVLTRAQIEKLFGRS